MFKIGDIVTPVRDSVWYSQFKTGRVVRYLFGMKFVDILILSGDNYVGEEITGIPGKFRLYGIRVNKYDV